MSEPKHLGHELNHFTTYSQTKKIKCLFTLKQNVQDSNQNVPAPETIFMEDANKNKTGANCIVSVLYQPESTCVKGPSSLL